MIEFPLIDTDRTAMRILEPEQAQLLADYCVENRLHRRTVQFLEYRQGNIPGLSHGYSIAPT